MNRNRFYYVIILILILTNVFLINEIIHQKSDPPSVAGRGKLAGIPGPRNIIIERLKLSDKQVEEYDELIKWHRANIEDCDEKIIKIKSELYRNLNSQESSNDSLLEELNKIQYKVEEIHLKHFADIENLCNSEQKKYFEELKFDLAKLFAKRKH